MNTSHRVTWRTKRMVERDHLLNAIRSREDDRQTSNHSQHDCNNAFMNNMYLFAITYIGALICVMKSDVSSGHQDIAYRCSAYDTRSVTKSRLTMISKACK